MNKFFYLALSLLLIMFNSNGVTAQDDGHHHKPTDATHGTEEHKENSHSDEHDSDERLGAHNDHTEKTGDHDQHGHDEDVVQLSLEQQKMAGIITGIIRDQKTVNTQIYAPGEVVNNLYNTTVVTAQVPSKVLKRYVVLGQHVRGGDPLVKLFSQDVVNIQSQLKVASQEWERVQRLGKKSVGSKRFNQTKVSYEKEMAHILALGISEKAVTDFIQEKSNLALGQYILEAPYEGTIQADNFQQGQLLAAGAPIATVVDETQLWVEARLAPQLGQHIGTGTTAKVVVRGKQFTATVIQENHAIEEITRTRKVRLLVKNNEHLLHPGLFADVYLTLKVNQTGVSIPETALIRSSDGDWIVFVQNTDERFKAQEVELINTVKDQHLVSGLSSGQRIVLQGAFFLASEKAKSNFDPHNH